MVTSDHNSAAETFSSFQLFTPFSHIPTTWFKAPGTPDHTSQRELNTRSMLHRQELLVLTDFFSRQVLGLPCRCWSWPVFWWMMMGTSCSGVLCWMRTHSSDKHECWLKVFEFLSTLFSVIFDEFYYVWWKCARCDRPMTL